MTDLPEQAAARSWSLPLADRPRMAVVRDWVRGHLAGMANSEDAVLVVVELVTNAYRHAGGASALSLACEADDTIRVEVADPDPALPELRPLVASCPGGRGLRMVDRISVAWGTRAQSGGKVVWSRLAG